MNNFITETFERMDIEKIKAFILHGTEQEIIHDSPYAERIKHACTPIYKRLEILHLSQSELTEASNELSNAITAYQEIYMEIGMKAGARLLHQLLITDENKLQNS